MRCSYCGQPAQALDHVIPLSVASSEARKNGSLTNRKTCVPCCTECNSVLGNKAFYTVGARAGYLAKRYPSRYKKLLRFPPWSSEELQDVGYTLRHIIDQDTKAKHETRLRIEHCEHVANVAPTILEVWEAVDEDLGRC